MNTKYDEIKRTEYINTCLSRKEKQDYILHQMNKYDDGQRWEICGLMSNTNENIKRVKYMHTVKLNELYHDMSYDINEMVQTELYFSTK